jgi:hypothetical protein
MSFRHSFMALTTDFELEPILDEYLAAYPEGEIDHYLIAFKTEGEHRAGHFSYIVVFELKKAAAQVPRFTEFLNTYCKNHNQVAFASLINHILPKLDAYGRGYHVFGNPAKYLDA